ncbi:MAG: hypothetical protein ABWZ80_05505 [Beijerinckiaceae bacterium]
MSNVKKVPSEHIAITAERGGLKLDDAKATRISNAISPAVANFSCPSLKLPMPEEPSGWAQRAFGGVRR